MPSVSGISKQSYPPWQLVLLLHFLACYLITCCSPICYGWNAYTSQNLNVKSQPPVLQGMAFRRWLGHRAFHQLQLAFLEETVCSLHGLRTHRKSHVWRMAFTSVTLTFTVSFKNCEQYLSIIDKSKALCHNPKNYNDNPFKTCLIYLICTLVLFILQNPIQILPPALYLTLSHQYSAS